VQKGQKYHIFQENYFQEKKKLVICRLRIKEKRKQRDEENKKVKDDWESNKCS